MYQVNLLLIEDCIELREILHWDIETNFPNINVKSCSTFKEAIFQLENNHVQIVISDFYLSGANALDLYVIYKNSIRFIMMSGDGCIKNKLKNLHLPFIEKPFNSSQLTKFIQTEIDVLEAQNIQYSQQV